MGGGGWVRGEGGVGGYDLPREVSISITSSRVTRPSLSRSRIWKLSRISRTWAGGRELRPGWFTGGGWRAVGIVVGVVLEVGVEAVGWNLEGEVRGVVC